MIKGPYAALIDWFARNSVAANLLMLAIVAGSGAVIGAILKLG